MPQVPIYDRQVISEPVKTVPLNTDLFTSGGQQFKETGQQLNEIANKFNEIDILRRKTKASNDLAIELNQIKTQAVNDPDINSMPKYEARINESISKYSGLVPEGQARFQASEEFRIDGYNAFAQVRDNYRTRAIESQQLETYLSLEKLRQEYIETNDVDVKNGINIKANALIDDNFKAGLFTAEQARTQKEAINRKWRVDEASFDASTNPSLYESKRSEYGLTSEEIADADEVSRKTKEKLDRIEKAQTFENQFKNEVDAIDNYLQFGQNENFLSIIDEKVSTGDWSVEFGQAWKKVLLKPELIDPNLNVEDSGFLELSQGILKYDNKEDLRKGVVNLLNQSGEKKINQEQLEVLLKSVKSRYEELNKGENKIFKYGKAILDKALGVESRTTGMMVGTVSKVLYKYFQNVLKGDKPEDAKMKAIDDTAIEKNPNRTSYSIGDVQRQNGMSFEVIRFDDNGNPIFKKL